MVFLTNSDEIARGTHKFQNEEYIRSRRTVDLIDGAAAPFFGQSDSSSAHYSAAVVIIMPAGIEKDSKPGKDGSGKKIVGNILLGFSVLMFGMETMSGAVAPLKNNEAFTGMLTAFSNPILGMIAGAVLTAVNHFVGFAFLSDTAGAAGIR